MIDLKLYYDKHLPALAGQVHQQKDIAISILNLNSSMNAANAEWESEWNQAGLGSRLSEQVCSGMWNAGPWRGFMGSESKWNMVPGPLENKVQVVSRRCVGACYCPAGICSSGYFQK